MPNLQAETLLIKDVEWLFIILLASILQVVSQGHEAGTPKRLGYPKFGLQQGSHVFSVLPPTSCRQGSKSSLKGFPDAERATDP